METLFGQWEKEYREKHGKEIMQKAMQEVKQEIAWNSFNEGLPEEMIANITRLSIEEIREMHQEWSNKKNSNTTHNE